jgi:hypothetical protein
MDTIENTSIGKTDENDSKIIIKVKGSDENIHLSDHLKKVIKDTIENTRKTSEKYYQNNNYNEYKILP